MSTGERAPAMGERSAALGLDAQYLLAAGLIYDHLLGGRLEWIAVADPRAGRIDDMQIATRGLLDAYQFKWHQHPPHLTYRELKGDDRGGGFIAQLADGWTRLCEFNPERRVRVHLFTNSTASTSGIEVTKAAGHTGVPHHIAAFLVEAWGRTESSDAIDFAFARWQPCLDELRAASGIPDDSSFESFRRDCLIETGQRLPVAVVTDGEGARSQRDHDIESLAALLFRVVGREPSVVRLTRQELISRLEWGDRFEFKAKHEFPLTPAYQPIEETVGELEEAVNRNTRGYVALLGTPGSGKSSLLTGTLRHREGIRVIQYYCFVPHDSRLSRGEAANFLHDLTLALWLDGVRPSALGPCSSLEGCRALFQAQLGELHAEYGTSGHRTLILVDGLDHIEREQSPHRSLLTELPPPASVPDGVLILLGSQKLDLERLSPRIGLQLKEDGRTVMMRPLSRRAVHAVVEASGLSALVTAPDLDEIARRSAGHPLALAYLVNRLRDAKTNADAELAIETSPMYDDTIEQEYEVYWTQHLDADEIRDLLAMASRLRVPLDLSAAGGWVGENVVQRLVKSGKQYFAADDEGHWRFFHNSFRQFVLDRTGRSPFRDSADPQRDRDYHRRLADLANAAAPEDSFSWEEVYHLFQVGEPNAVIEVATQSWFRKQYLEGRAPHLIRDDIGWALRAGRDLRESMCLVRLLLADEEISERTEVLDSLDLPGIHLALGDPEEALSASVHDGQLKAERTRVLNLADELLRAGYPSHARQAFDAAEPLDLLSGSRKVDPWGAQRNELIRAWLEVAHHFLPVADVVSAIARLDIDERASGGTGDPETEKQKVREGFLVNLADSIVASGAEGRCTELLQAARAQLDASFVARLDQRMDETRIALHPHRPSGAAALDRLLAVHASSQLSVRRRLLVADRALQIKGDAETANTLLEGIPQPASLAWRKGGDRPQTLAPFTHLIRFYRLLAALRRPIEPEIAVPNTDDEDTVADVLLERMIVRSANVWGAAWRGDIDAPALVWSALLPTVRIQEISRSDRGKRPHYWYSYQRVAGDYFDLVVQAAAAHGSDALARFGEEIESRWTSSSTADLWPANLRRTVALLLLRSGDDPERLRRTLEAIEPNLGVKEDVHDRISNFESQIRAWAELGDLERARSLMPRLLAGSFGIYHDKDAQLGQWIYWFEKALESGDEQAESDTSAFMSGVASTASARRGYAPVEDAEAAITTVARNASPAAADVYRRAFLDQGSLQFERGVAALCCATVRLQGAVPVTCAVVGHLILPYTEQNRADLARDLGRAIGDLDDRTLAARLLSSIEDAIDIDAAPDLRNGWRKAIAEGGGSSRNSGLFVHILPPESPSTERASFADDEHASVTLRDGSTLTPAEIRRRGRDKENLFKLIDNISESHFYDWLSLVKPLASSLEAEEAARLLTALRTVGASPRHARVLWDRLRELGRFDLLEADAKAALDSSERHGWYRILDGGSRIEPLQVLTEINERYRELALGAFIEDYLGGVRNPRDAVQMLDELAGLFWAQPPVGEIWREIREHVFQLEDFRAPVARFPSVDASAEGGLPVAEGVLVGVLFYALGLPMPEVREDAYRAVVAVATEGSCIDLVAGEIEALLVSHDEGLLLGLSLLDALPAGVLPPSDNLTHQIATAASSGDAAVRNVAVRLATKLGIQPVSPCTPRALPAVYTMSLPPFVTEDRPYTAALLDPGTVLPDTTDPLEIVGCALPILKVVARTSGIPLRNVVERAESLMRSSSSDEPWDSNAERELMARSRTLGLETSYRRPRAAAALRATAIIVGELLAAGELSDDVGAILVPALALRDRLLADVHPERRFAGRQLVLIELKMAPGEYLSHEAWVAGTEDTATLEWPDPPPGAAGEVLGFDYRAHLPDWGRFEEKRRGAFCAPDLDLSDAAELFENLLPTEFFRQAACYPRVVGAHRGAGEALLVRGSSMRVEIGRAEWIALNPVVGRDCGWRTHPGGLFRWIDNQGRAMVESRWWRDGRYGRPPRHDDTRAEGWLVWASRRGADELQRRCGDLGRVQAVMRSAFTHDKHLLEGYRSVSCPR